MQKSVEVEYLRQEGNPLVVPLRRNGTRGDRERSLVGDEFRCKSNFMPSYGSYSPPIMSPGEARVSNDQHRNRNHPVSLGKHERVVFQPDH